jgi:phosphate uptake regulator
MLKAAEAMESAARQLETLSITDQRLQSYRLRYVNIYRQTGSATRDFITAYERRDPDEARIALQALQVATSPEKQLVAEINNYCRT